MEDNKLFITSPSGMIVSSNFNMVMEDQIAGVIDGETGERFILTRFGNRISSKVTLLIISAEGTCTVVGNNANIRIFSDEQEASKTQFELIRDLSLYKACKAVKEKRENE